MQKTFITNNTAEKLRKTILFRFKNSHNPYQIHLQPCLFYQPLDQLVMEYCLKSQKDIKELRLIKD